MLLISKEKEKMETMISCKSIISSYINQYFSKFHDGTCINAYNIALNLCQWLETYFYEDNLIVLESSK